MNAFSDEPMRVQAFFKRVAFAISPDRNPWDDTVQVRLSLGWFTLELMVALIREQIGVVTILLLMRR